MSSLVNGGDLSPWIAVLAIGLILGALTLARRAARAHVHGRSGRPGAQKSPAHLGAVRLQDVFDERVHVSSCRARPRGGAPRPPPW